MSTNVRNSRVKDKLLIHAELVNQGHKSLAEILSYPELANKLQGVLNKISFPQLKSESEKSLLTHSAMDYKFIQLLSGKVVLRYMHEIFTNVKEYYLAMNDLYACLSKDFYSRNLISLSDIIRSFLLAICELQLKNEGQAFSGKPLFLQQTKKKYHEYQRGNR